MRKDTWRVAVSAAAIAMVAMPSWAATPVFETKNDIDTAKIYTFGTPVESGETAQSNIGSTSGANNNRFAFRTGTVNVKAGGYVRVSGYDSPNDYKAYANWCGCNGDSATLNVMGGTFWVDKGSYNLSTYPGVGRLRIGVNSAGNGRTGVARVNVSAGLFRVDNILMCGASIYNANTSQNAPVEMNISGGTAVVETFWLGAQTGSLSSTAEFNLTGGELQVNSFVFQPCHSQTFNWGSGKIVAGQADVFTSENLAGNATRTVNVTGAPAVFDTGNFAQTIPADIAGASGTGTLKLTGGNTVTLSTSPSYSLWLDDGTTLAILDLAVPANGSFTFSGDATVDGSLTLGSEAVIVCNVDDLLPSSSCTLTVNGGIVLSDGGSVLDSVIISGVGAADCAKSISGDTITVEKSGDPDYVWNGSGTNWSDVDAWDNSGSTTAWSDNNNAIFSTANATATLTADASANALAFNADATIAGSSTLTVPTVSVASGVSAVISTPTAGVLEKTGAGTLTLGSSRTDATTLSEGTLALSGTTSLNWSNFTFGTDPAKPVVLDFGPTATLSSVPATWYIGNIAGITSTVVKNGGDWTFSGDVRVGSGAGTVAAFYNKGGSISASRLLVGDDNTTGHTGTGYCEISGGTVTCTGTDWPIIGCYSDGTVVVTNNGSLVCNSNINVGYDNTTTGTLTVADGGSVKVAGSVIMCKDNPNVNASGILNIRTGGTVAAKNVWRGDRAGSGTVNFDGGTFKKNTIDGNIFTANVNNEVDVTVSANGGTIDNNAFSVTLPCTITGAGGMTFVGSGTTAVSVNQSYLGTTTVADGTTLSVANGVSFAGPVAFEAGAKLNIAGYDNAAAFVAASVTLPAEGTVSLTLNGGAFAEGVYAICSASGLTREDGSKFSFEMEDGVAESKWSVVNDMLVLIVGNVDPNAWTGLGGDGRMSNGANWYGGEVPAAGAGIDLSSISSDTTIIADAGRTFGTVTVGSGVITFTNELSATAFAAADGGPNPTAKISVAADSTVTLDGDLEFAANEVVYVCHSVAAGGVFAVTGDIIATPQQTTYVGACVTTSIDGTISARGLVSNSSHVEGIGLARGLQGSHVQWLIGDHGISGTTRLVLGNKPNVAATITAAADFIVSAEIIQNRSLTFNTGGHTITLGAGTSEKSGGISGNVFEYQDIITTIAGSGKVIVNYNVNDLASAASSRTNVFSVATGATLTLNPGANIGFGTLTVQEGATLEIQSGTTTFGNLTVAENAILGFNFTDRRNAPVLALYDGAEVNAPDPFTVKVSGTVWPLSGEKLLTTCGGFDGIPLTLSAAGNAARWAKQDRLSVNTDGNLVLDVKPMGTVILFR